jgi:hypothetical protein
MGQTASPACRSAVSAREAFRTRFVLAPFDGNGVLLDLGTGAFHHLNCSATTICAYLLQGQTAEEVSVLLGRAWGEQPPQINEAIEELLTGLEDAPSVAHNNAIAFEEDENGARMCIRGRAILRLERDDRTITSLITPSDASEELAAALLLIAPHLLTLRHQAVLHASAVLCSRGVLAFCGGSGQGKTTTAHHFAACGAELLAEDLLLLSLDKDYPRVIRGAESAIRSWAAQHGIILAQQGQIDTRTSRRFSPARLCLWMRSCF